VDHHLAILKDKEKMDTIGKEGKETIKMIDIGIENGKEENLIIE
jgi:hypothetical protein